MRYVVEKRADLTNDPHLPWALIDTKARGASTFNFRYKKDAQAHARSLNAKEPKEPRKRKPRYDGDGCEGLEELLRF